MWVEVGSRLQRLKEMYSVQGSVFGGCTQACETRSALYPTIASAVWFLKVIWGVLLLRACTLAFC